MTAEVCHSPQVVNRPPLLVDSVRLLFATTAIFRPKFGQAASWLPRASGVTEQPAGAGLPLWPVRDRVGSGGCRSLTGGAADLRIALLTRGSGLGLDNSGDAIDFGL